MKPGYLKAEITEGYLKHGKIEVDVGVDGADSMVFIDGVPAQGVQKVTLTLEVGKPSTLRIDSILEGEQNE